WKQGSTARLQCTVKGSPELHSTWFLNNSELSTGGRHAVGLKDGVATLEIHDVLLTDSGNYTCEVLNECGCESCSIKVTVKEPPSFRKELLSTEAVRGSVAVLECEIAGSAPLEVSWKKNKKRLSSDKKYSIVSQGSLASLEIQSFESADTGEYECVVSNEVGSATSKSVLKQKEPPVFSKRIESATAVLGNTVKLQGTLKGSVPITIKWMKDSELLRDDDPNIKMSFVNNITSVSFSSVELKHGGKYTCLAENEAGQQKCECKIQCVLEPARILEKAASISVTAGDSATLECTISGSPELKVKWFKDGKEMIGGRKYKIASTASVTITGLDQSDGGVYTCKASNDAGEKETSGTLSIKEPPAFTSKPESLDASPGSNIVLKSDFTGSAPLTVKWFREEKEIFTGGKYFIKKDSSSSSLELHSVKPSDSAKYTCQVSNDAGKVDCTAALFIKGAEKLLLSFFL
uniref:Ig-like domain-containing protein n=1 Tax=Haplochromis burtoni TaxID=8153 RepID=A0A3Q2XG43_HAPBU